MNAITKVDKTDYLAHYGPRLIERGYLVVPLAPGRKYPTADEWQNLRLGVADLVRYPGHGVGVICGKGNCPVVAIDIDVLDEALCERFLTWCREHLGDVACERVGRAPKILLVYRVMGAPWRKMRSNDFVSPAGSENHLEVLCDGQQFVAYQTHPDTGRPYEWVDLVGGISVVPAADLPAITEVQAAEAIRVFEAMAAEAGFTPVPGRRAAARGGAPSVGDALMTYQPALEDFDIGTARRALAFVDNRTYDDWLAVGMALHHQFVGSDEALDLWNEWSSSAPNYVDFDDLAKRWERFGQSDRTPTTARWLLKVLREGERAAAAAEKRSTRDEIKSRIEACRDSIALMDDLAPAAGKAANGDVALHAELAGLVRTQFKQLTGSTLLAADVHRAMGAGGAPQLRRNMTEFGNAERMLDHYASGLRYVPQLDAWFNWTGNYWRRAAGVELEHLAKETVRALPNEADQVENDSERAAFFKFCAISQKANMITNMVSLARSDPRVVVHADQLDRHSHLLGVGNGAVDLRTGELLTADPLHYITTITPVEYDPDAAAPLFEQTVSDVFFGQVSMIGFFQRLIGYSLLGKPVEDILAIPFGSGSNGKSTVLGVIREVLGGHARMASADTFLASRGQGGNAGGPREDVLRLRGARFVYVSEPDEGSELREGLVKSMTGGEALPARGVHAKSTIEVQPTWTVFMPTNHRPIVKGDDHGIWRRLLLVPFTRNFDRDPTVQKDPQRADKLRSEAAGVLAWCVRGALEYQRIGLALPDDVKQAREDYRSDMDLLREWIDECCEVGANVADSNANLWASWEAFASARGELRFIASQKAFTRRLGTRGFVQIKDVPGVRGRGLRGICAKPLEF